MTRPQPMEEEHAHASLDLAPTADPVERRWNLALASSATVALGVVIVLTLVPNALSDRLVDGDFYQHGYWMWRFLDPGLFPDDPVTAYFAGPAAPPLYTGLYRVLVPLFGNPEHAMEAVAIGLAIVSGGLAWRLGVWAGGGRTGPTRWLGIGPTPPTRDRRGRWPAAGGAAAVMFLAVIQADDTKLLEPLGLQRAFGLPLTLGVAVALAERRRVLTGMLLLATAGLYPVALAGLGLFAFVVELARLLSDRRLPPRAWALGPMAATAVAILLLRESPESLGPLVTAEQARQLPEFGPGGRQQFFAGTWLEFWFVSHRSGLGFKPHKLGPAVALAAAGIAAAGQRSVPALAWAALLTGLGLWVAAHALLFELYLPQRYTTDTVPLFGVLVAGGVMASLLSSLAGRAGDPEASAEAGGSDPASDLSPRDRWGPRLAPLAALGVFALLCLGPLRSFSKGAAAEDRLRGPDYAAVMEDLREAPLDTVVAGLPGRVNDLPHRGHRSVLISREQALAYHRGFYRDVVAPRVEASVRLYQARSWAEADRLAEAAGVDLWLTWLEEEDPLYGLPGEPFDSLLHELRAAPGEPVWAEAPPERLFSRHGDWALIRIGDGFPAEQNVKASR